MHSHIRTIRVIRVISISLFSVLLFSVFPSPASAQSYEWQKAGPNQIDYPKTCTHYVATDGNDNDSGTSLNKAWKTLQHAASESPKGSTICVRGGKYILDRDDDIKLKKGAQRFTNYQKEKPVIQGNTPVNVNANPDVNYKGAFSLESPGNTVENFEIRDRIGVGIAIKNTGNTNLSNNIVRNNLVHNVGNTNININADSDDDSSDTRGVKIQYNIMEYACVDPDTKKWSYPQAHASTGVEGHDCSLLQLSGIRSSTASEKDALIIEGNVLKYHQNHGFMGDANDGMSRGFIVRNNLFAGAKVYLHFVDDVIWDSNFHYYFEGTNGAGEINRFGFTSGEVDDLTEMNRRYSKEVLKTKDVYITNNFLYSDSIAFRLKVEDDLGQLENTFFKGNTVISATNNGIGLELLAGRKEFFHKRKGKTYVGDVTYDQAFKGLTLEDNIFYAFSSQTTLLEGDAKYEGKMYDRPPAGVEWRNNLWSRSPGNASDFSMDLIANPRFTNATSPDNSIRVTDSTDPVKLLNQIKLLNNSPAINQASNNSLATDFFGASRPVGNKSDIGAEEFGGTPITPVPLKWDLNNDTRVNLFDFPHFINYFKLSDFGFPDLSDFITGL